MPRWTSEGESKLADYSLEEAVLRLDDLIDSALLGETVFFVDSSGRRVELVPRGELSLEEALKRD